MSDPLTKDKCSICGSPNHTHLHCYGTDAQRTSKTVLLGDLLPCPFCGQSNRTTMCGEIVTDYQWVECICGATGPESSSAESAAAFWNQRPAVETAAPRPPHWTCRTHGDFDALRAVGCPECMRLARQALIQIQRETYGSRWEASQAAHKIACAALDPMPPLEPARELSASEAASFDKTLARSPRRVDSKEHLVKGLASAGSSAAVNPRDTVGGSAEPSGRPAEKLSGPVPDHLKAPVKAGDQCPAIDDVHTGHQGKCVYCGAPMTQEKASAPLCERHGQIVETGCPACEAALGRVAEPWVCPKCQQLNSAGSTTCGRCDDL